MFKVIYRPPKRGFNTFIKEFRVHLESTDLPSVSVNAFICCDFDF